MFGIGPLELLVIAIVAGVLIGPDKLPDTMKKLGRFFVQARRQVNEVRDTFQQVVHDAEREIEMERIRELQAKLQAASPSQLLEAEIQKANAVSHEDDHAPYGAETFDHDHDHNSNNPDYIAMDHFAKAPDPVLTHEPVASSPEHEPAATSATLSTSASAEVSAPLDPAPAEPHPSQEEKTHKA